jgi:hypothetical protein
MLKSKTAANALPELEMVAFVPTSPVATVPIDTVAAAPVAPVSP